MLDRRNILYNGITYTKYEHPGPTNTGVAADANPTHAAGNTGFKALVEVDKIPTRGMYLAIYMPGPFTPSGTSGTAALTFTVTYSDDGTNTVTGLSHVSRTVTFTAATGPTATITTPSGYTGITQYVLYMRLPEVNHDYIKVAWATTLGTITTMDYGAVTIALEQGVDTESANHIDIG